MPRRERDRELARRRKRKAERRKLRAKGLLGERSETLKASEKKRVKKPSLRQAAPPEAAVQKVTESAAGAPQEEARTETVEPVGPEG